MALLIFPVAAPRPPPSGPRESARIRTLALRAEEVAARHTAVGQFEKWAQVASPQVTLEEIARSNVPLLSDLLQEYVYQCYEERFPVGHCRHLLVGVADRFGWLRRVLGGPWKVVSAWERAEPAEPRAPIPVKWVRALIIGALTLGWMNMALSLLLGFYALLRPIELFTLRRRDLLLPGEHEQGPFILVQLRGPKTRWRGRPNEYVRVDETPIVQAVTALATRLRSTLPV